MATLTLRTGSGTRPGVLAVPVAAPTDGDVGTLPGTAVGLPADLTATLLAYLADVEHAGTAGTTHVLPRPGARPYRVVLVGIGAGSAADWRAAGAGVVRAVTTDTAVTVALPAGAEPDAVAGFAEGALLAAYRWSLVSANDDAPALRRITLAADDPDRYVAALDRGRTIAEATVLARDWTNTPSGEKSPAWLAAAVVREARRAGVRARIRDADELAAEGFGGILAVGAGSPRPPTLVELRWRPRGATRHVVLVGKGITYDTGGIQLKPTSGMQLMRKDMGGAAAVAAATVGAARLGLPVKITTLLPLADNFLSGDAFRPGDVVRHYGGLTSEIQNTDAEGRIVLADALAYAVRRLAPDVVVDLATLTGAQSVALGKKTAALYAADDALAATFTAAADAAGEPVWRMPMPADYVDEVRSSLVADLNNAPIPGVAGSVMAALFLREFLGDRAGRWLHVDMSAPAWSSSAEGVHAKGATGWGVRTLIGFLDRR